MSMNIALLVGALLLAYGFWVSPEFTEIAAGVAIFLFGMLSLSGGFKSFTGGTLERILQRSTDRMWKSILFGFSATTVMQSSTLVSVISISFLSAGLLGLTQGVGIIFGANLGSTTGAWLVAGLGLKVNISAWAMPMLVFGAMLVFSKNPTLKGIGQVLSGIGFLFLGIHYMKTGFETFGQSIDLSVYAMPGVAGLLLFTLIGIFATIVMQSSHATLVLVITALAAGQITYENALALAIGANVGTTFTAVIGSLSANIEGRRLAGAHFLFNVTTGILVLILFRPFVAGVDSLADLLGIDADNHTLRLALFHTLFSVAGVALMLPLTKRLVWFLETYLKPKPRTVVQPHFINPTMLEMPDAGLEAARKELQHLFGNTFDVMALALHVDPVRLRRGEDLELLNNAPERVRAVDIDDYYARRVKPLYGDILDFLARLDASGPQTAKVFALRSAGLQIVEALKDLKDMQKNLARYLAASTLHPREEYVSMRRNLAVLLHALHTLSTTEDGTDQEAAITAIEIQARAGDLAANGHIDALMRERRIGPEQASSLMNDSAYAARITSNLLAMARTVFVPGQPGHPLESGPLGNPTSDTAPAT